MSDQNYSHQYSGYYSHQNLPNKQHVPMAGDFPGGPLGNNPEPQFLVPALPNRDLHPQARPGPSNLERHPEQFGGARFVMNMPDVDGQGDRKPGVLYHQQTVGYPQTEKRPEVYRQQQWNQVSQEVIEQMHGQ
ncbi:hypothetical protein FO519_003603 [Halicephalobus sp. NKZ332]|nr:hypothetical protein FO519_003603 [Halicephalobus sp. NKZ332]